MNAREAMTALLEGKKLCCEDWGPTEFIAFAPDGVLRDDGGCSVRSIRADDGVYELYEEKNPHTPGTFAWAYEECARGKSVRRPGKNTYKYIGGSAGIFAVDAVATDWEVVP